MLRGRGTQPRPRGQTSNSGRWSGVRVAVIAAELGCHAKTVRWWLHRFNALGLDGSASACPR
ncbi:helix-turn-helix domain-containing protein [Kitasatospora sp. NPDC089797]|uniref:helix-turn-helix domain-containing protein n=1 Tax=Kitasatospora sp. NPDC089797 TaxID=3155298 RepID=UPI00343FC425